MSSSASVAGQRRPFSRALLRLTGQQLESVYSLKRVSDMQVAEVESSIVKQVHRLDELWIGILTLTPAHVILVATSPTFPVPGKRVFNLVPDVGLRTGLLKIVTK